MAKRRNGEGIPAGKGTVDRLMAELEASLSAPAKPNIETSKQRIRKQRFLPRNRPIRNYGEDGFPAVAPDLRVNSWEPEAKREPELSRKPPKKQKPQILSAPDKSEFVQVETDKSKMKVEIHPEPITRQPRIRPQIVPVDEGPFTQMETKKTLVEPVPAPEAPKAEPKSDGAEVKPPQTAEPPLDDWVAAFAEPDKTLAGAEAVTQPEGVQSGPEEFADEVKAMLSEKLGEEAEVTKLTIIKALSGRMLVRAKLHQRLAGEIELDGALVNNGSTIGIEGLNVKSERFQNKVKSTIEENLSDFGVALKSHFEKKYGKPISGIRADESGFTIGFVGSILAEEKKSDAQVTAATAEAGDKANIEKTPAEIAAENRRVALSIPAGFETPLTEDAKKSHDPLHRLLKRMSEDPEADFNEADANLNYQVVMPYDEEGKLTSRDTRAETYHDALRLRGTIPGELRRESDKLGWNRKSGQKWTKMEIFANNEKFWNRLNDPSDKLSKYKDEFYTLLEAVKSEQSPDEYANAISRGEITVEGLKKDIEREQTEVFGTIQQLTAQQDAIFKDSSGREFTAEEQQKYSELGNEIRDQEKRLNESVNKTELYEEDSLQREPLTDPDKVRARLGELQNLSHEINKLDSLDDYKKYEVLTRQWVGLHYKLTEAGESTKPPEIPPADKRIEPTLGAKGGTLREMATDMKEFGQFIGEGFSESSGFLKNRSKALGVGLRKLGLDVIGDFKLAGKGIAYVATNPMESLRATRTGGERAIKYAKYFADSSKTYDERAEKMKFDLKRMVEGYNKMPFRYKAYITAALISGSALTAAAGLPTLAKILASGMYGVRALGSAGFALNRRKGMESPESLFEGMSNVSKNIYAGVFTAAYMGATSLAGHYAIENVTKWFGNVFGHGASIATEVASPPTSGEIPRPTSYPQEVFQKPPVEVPPAGVPAGPTAEEAAKIIESAKEQLAKEIPARDAIQAGLDEVKQQIAEEKAQAAAEASTPQEARQDLRTAVEKITKLTENASAQFEMPKHADFSIHEDDTTISPYDVTPTDQSGAEDILSAEGVEEQAVPAVTPEVPAETPAPIVEPEEIVLKQPTESPMVDVTGETAPIPTDIPNGQSLIERLEAAQSPTESRSILDSLFSTNNISHDTVAEAVKAAPHMDADPSLVKVIEPNTGVIPGPAVFLGKDGGLTVYGAASTGDSYTVQRAIAERFAALSGQSVKVLLPNGAEGYELVHPDGLVSIKVPAFFDFSYKPPLPVTESVYVFKR